MGIKAIATAHQERRNSMAIEKVVIETIVCDKCKKKGKEADGWKKGVTIQLGDAKWKGDLCPPDYAKIRGFSDEFLEDMAEGVTTPAGDYDPHADPRMKKMTRAEREKHYAAKTWAVGPNSTVAKDYRPTSVRGPAGEKVLIAYEIYLREQEIKREAAAKQPAPA
jgi:hypothetical protein